MCFNAICVETKSLSAISLTEKSNKKDDEKNFKRGIRNVLLKGEENSTSNNNRNSYNGKGNGGNNFQSFILMSKDITLVFRLHIKLICNVSVIRVIMI